MAIIYTKGDTVTYGGSTYVATRDILDTDPAPGNGTMWALLAAAGPSYRSLTHTFPKKPTWRDSTWTDVSWVGWFRLMDASLGNEIPASGYIDIAVPPAGTAIQVNDGSGSRLAVANGIPLAAWESIYYVPPIGGGAINQFRITTPSWPQAIPSHWVHIVTRNSHNSPYDTYHWGDGQQTQHWWSMVLNSPWVAYGAGYSDPAFRKENGIVHLQGLVRFGGTSSDITVLPAWFRPSQNLIFGAYASGAYTRIDVSSDGRVTWVTGSNSDHVALNGISFVAEQ